jgi:hypothetical protein
MAVFRTKDREKRREWKAYHATAMSRARDAVYWTDPETSIETYEAEQWEDYKAFMIREGQTHVNHERFLKELRKA